MLVAPCIPSGLPRRLQGLWSRTAASVTRGAPTRPFEAKSRPYHPIFACRSHSSWAPQDHRAGDRVKHRSGAKEAALKLLGYRSYPERQLVDKLTEKGFAPDDIHNALQDLKRLGLIGDTEYAETFVRSKWRQQLWAPRRLGMEMSRIGIGKPDQAVALASHFGRAGLQLRDFLGPLQAEDLRAAAASAFLSQDSCREAEALSVCLSKLRRERPRAGDQQRFYAWLQRRGFSFDEARRLWLACQAARDGA